MTEAQKEIEWLEADGQVLCLIVRASYAPDRTTFLTPPELTQQIGHVVYPRGGEVARHYHVPVDRRITGTSECLIVRSGRCEVDVYNDDGSLVHTRELAAGDVFLTVGGGHGFRMLEDTVLLEVKQGPYGGVDEKVRF